MKRRFYREYTASCGYGVMVAFDTVLANDREEAINAPMHNRYGRSNAMALEFIMEVPKDEYYLSDLDLSKKYGQEDS